MTTPGTPFDQLDDFLDVGRLSGLALSPEGDRLVVTVAALNEKKTAYVSSLWEVDPAGDRPAHRLTWGRTSESSPAFLPDGSLLFCAQRPDPSAEPATDDPASLWRLPRSGEARPVVSPPGGLHGVTAARDVGVVLFAGPSLPSSTDAADDARRRKVRTDGKVTAILHDSYPIRYWDHDLGPDRDRLFTARLADDDLPSPSGPTDLTGHVGYALSSESSWSISPDGSRAVVSWRVPEPGGSFRQTLQSIDLATGERTVLLDDPEVDFLSPVFSPDGTKVALVTERRSTPYEPVDLRVCVLHLKGRELHEAAPEWDRWGDGLVWTPDGSALLAVADDDGRCPVWRLDLDTRTATRLTADAAAYGDLQLSRDGSTLYAIRSAVDAMPTPVRLDPSRPDREPTMLRGPVVQPELPGSLEEIRTTAADGTPIRSWLVLPAGETPAPLLVWMHGGPLGSWNSWHWRWNPWLAAARGYAVLLPDPALSTGYGLAAIRRSWGRWGSESYDDVMTLTDAAVARDDIDASRTAALGGSYGGYLANWIAGHTDRFRGIVSHAGLWGLSEFGHSTDDVTYWRREMTAQMAADNSPDRFVGSITTPMLIIHGDQDYRVPVFESVRLWTELALQNESSDGQLKHRFLLFPDENHWILKPQHAKLWYETIFAFLEHTLYDKPFEVPEILR